MICSVQGPEDPRSRDLLMLCTAGPCGCRIASYFACYHPFPELAQFWVCYQEDIPRCALCSAGGVLTVTDTRPGGALEEELSAFFDFHGTPVLREDVSSGVVWHQTGETLWPFPIMRLEDRSVSAARCALPDGFQAQEPVRLKDAWELVQRCFGEEAPSQEDFIGDLSHRQRRGRGAMVLLQTKNGAPVSFAAAAAMTEEAALIGSVCTHPDFRRKGVGGCCVAQLLQTLAGHTVYLLRKPGEQEAFYRRLGFENLPPAKDLPADQGAPDE